MGLRRLQRANSRPWWTLMAGVHGQEHGQPIMDDALDSISSRCCVSARNDVADDGP